MKYTNNALLSSVIYFITYNSATIEGNTEYIFVYIIIIREIVNMNI